MIHLRSIVRSPRPKRCDVRAAATVRAATHQQLRNEIAEAAFDAIAQKGRIALHRDRSEEFRRTGAHDN